jgi:hypothetical protein
VPKEIVLTAAEIVEKRPFTEPSLSEYDLGMMRKMAHQLIDNYDNPAVCDFLPNEKPVCQSDPQGRHFRIYYVQARKLFSMKNLAVVGFFGHKRPGADVQPLIQADKKFEKTFHEHPGLLSLSTVRMANGDFANLVVFTDPEAKDKWNRMPLHYDTVSASPFNLIAARIDSIASFRWITPASLNSARALLAVVESLLFNNRRRLSRSKLNSLRFKLPFSKLVKSRS